MKNQTSTTFTEDRPIPASMSGKFSGWYGRAQQYPVFSQTWFKYRALTYSIPIAIFACIFGLNFLFSPQEMSPVYMAAAVTFWWLSLTSALLLGRWLAMRVRLLKMPQKKESICIALCLLCGLVVAQSFAWFAKIEHMPNGQVEVDRAMREHRRKENSVDRRTPAQKAQRKNEESKADIINFILNLGLFYWLCGGLDFIAYLRQNKMITEAANQERIDRYKKERNQAELKLSVLASQIEPHFLFNTLSGVRSAILNDPARGVAIIDHLVDYLRATIPQMRRDGNASHVTVESQLSAIRAYLGVIHFRIPRLSFTVESEPSLAQMAIPPLMLISLVENAVKHGIEPKKGSVHITVSAKKIQMDGMEKLALTVSDNGVGFGLTSSGTGIGLTNIRERLSQLYGDHAALILESNDAGGVDAILTLPIDSDSAELL